MADAPGAVAGPGPGSGPPQDPPTDRGRIAVHVDRLPARLQHTTRWLLEHAPGRVGTRTAALLRRSEMFDRAMTLSAQLFTSLFPLMIIASTVMTRSDAQVIGDFANLPPETQQVVDDAVESAGFEAFGIVGLLLVLVSATSLSRALARTYASVWELPRPASRLASWWRWLSVVVGLVLAILVLRYVARFTEGLTPGPLWTTLTLSVAYSVLMWVITWVLLENRVAPRLLLPGAVLTGVLMTVTGRVASLFLPQALASSNERYGAMGVAFTYLTYLYVFAVIIIICAVVGRALVTDEGGLGRWLRGGLPLPATAADITGTPPAPVSPASTAP